MSSAKKIILKSSDGKSFEVEEMVALESHRIKQMIEDDRAGSGIPPLNVTSKILEKVIEYCKEHVEDLNPTACKNREPQLLLRYFMECDELKKWDAEFINVDHDTLFDLTKAAFYLSIRGLVDLTCQTFTDVIKGKTPDEILKIFNSQNKL